MTSGYHAFLFHEQVLIFISTNIHFHLLHLNFFLPAHIQTSSYIKKKLSFYTKLLICRGNVITLERFYYSPIIYKKIHTALVVTNIISLS